MWYEWNSLEDFNTWHTNICTSLGIPNENTNAYTNVHEVNGKWIAVVHNSESNGLTATELRLPVIVRVGE
jgi:hypothetical protein